MKKQECIDRLSELPDSLAIHILSFMNVKEAAITSVLSKRWEFLWAELPILKFRADMSTLDTRGSGAIDKVRNFVAWVDRTLAIRTANCLEKFQVRFLYHNVLSSHVDAWVRFANKNNVKTLKLRLYFFDDYYRPPEALYSCASLTYLHVVGCYMDSQIRKKIEWRRLTNLRLQFSYVEQFLLDQMLSACPVLRTLFLKKCRGFNLLEVESPALHNLSIVECDYNVDAPAFKITAPHIRRLGVWLPVERRKLEVGIIKFLVRANIDCQEFSWDSISVEVMSGARQLLQTVQHADELYVGLQFIKLVSSMAVNGWQLPQSRRRRLLIVDSGSEHKHIISGIISLLDSSPNLETLIIEGCATEWKDAILEPFAEDDLAGDLLHLKTVKVTNFADSKGEPVLTLLRILLKRSPSLEELRIMSEVKDLSELTEMVQPILSYPGSSTKATVHLVKISA